MKRIVLLALIAFVAISVLPVSASASASASASEAKRHVVVDGDLLSGNAKVKSYVTFVPFRELFTKLGLTITYDPKTKQVSGESQQLKVSFTLGSKTAYINGEKKALQAAPFTEGGSVYVPLRIVGESTGSLVKYIPDMNVVLVNSPTFEGVVYETTYGDLRISADGNLDAPSRWALMEFLGETSIDDSGIQETIDALVLESQMREAKRQKQFK